MAEIPERDRPREKLIRKGAKALKTGELIAVIIGRGTRGRDVLAVSDEIKEIFDDREHEVTIEQLKELLTTVEVVLEDRSLAPKLLPVTQGFFFGSYDYDDWYWEDMQNTKDGLKEVIEDYERNVANEGTDGVSGVWVSYYYDSSW